jgi:hypothetical protein
MFRSLLSDSLTPDNETIIYRGASFKVLKSCTHLVSCISEKLVHMEELHYRGARYRVPSACPQPPLPKFGERLIYRGVAYMVTG